MPLEQHPNRVQDPQTIETAQIRLATKADVDIVKHPHNVITADIRKSSKSDSEVITLDLFLGLFQLVSILPCPDDEEQTTVPVYNKWKVRKTDRPPPRHEETNTIDPSNWEVMAYTTSIGPFQVDFVLPVPGEDEITVPVYCKYSLVQATPSTVSTATEASDEG
jgi:hypothetical protein